MRLSAAILSLALSLSPTLAADDIAGQAKQAYTMFAGGLPQEDFLGGQYGKSLFDGISGNWVRLNGPQKSGIETYGTDNAKFCQTPAALTLSSASPFSLTLSTNLEGNNFSQKYSQIAGSSFGEYTEPGPYLNAVGLGPERTGDQADQQRALLLSLANGVVQIYRPSADILVMTRDSGYPIVLARCAPGMLPKVN